MPIADLEKRREYDRERARKRYQPVAGPTNCAVCGGALPAHTGRGRKRKICENPDCRRRYKTRKQQDYDRGGVRKGRVYKSKAEKDRVWREANPDAVWGHSLKKAHAMRPEQWHAMWMEQSGCCYLCERPLPEDRSKVAIDHDHSHCGKDRSCGVCRRGLAHHACNTAIGLLEENAALLRVIAINLERQADITKALIIAAPAQGELFTPA